MIKKYVYGTPFETEAVTAKMEAEKGTPGYGEVCLEDGFSFTYVLAADDVVYGLGEANRGINKRGYRYVSNCTDDPNHTEEKCSLYGAHNFLAVSGAKTFGLFLDYPSKMAFDIGYTRSDTLTITCEEADLSLYVLEGDSAYDIVKQFRKIIGRSYIPPKFAFGFGQSRWGYRTKEDYREVAEGYRKNRIPLDMIYMDIDYMQDYKDFTLNEENFSDFSEFVREMKETIRLLKGHPSIAVWVIFNEGWGQFQTEDMTRIARECDGTRLIDQASGWFDQKGGDLQSIHNYFFKLEFTAEKERATVLSEFGGYSLRVEQHSACRKLYGYGTHKTMESLNAAYKKQMQKVKEQIPNGLCASVYTQLSDVEEEMNGIFTYDREVCKLRL